MSMKSADEIKKGLECCVDGNIVCDGNCVFDDDVKLGYPDCVKLLMTNALALIQQLQDDNAQLNRCIENMTDKLNAMNDEVAKLQAERDAAVNFLRSMGCDTCMYDDYDGSEPPCINCTAERSYWMWRGVQREDGNA